MYLTAHIYSGRGPFFILFPVLWQTLIVGHAPGTQQEVDWYVDDPDECRKEAGSPVIFAGVGSDDDGDSDVSETGSRALAAIQRSSIAIRMASMRDRSFRERYPDRVHPQPNMRPREENATTMPRPNYTDAEGDASVAVTIPNRDQHPPSAPENRANSNPPTDDSGEGMGMVLDYILGVGGPGGLDTRLSSQSLPLPPPKDRRKSKNKKKGNKGKEKRMSEESGTLSDSPNLLDVAPWADIMAPRRPSTTTVDLAVDDSFARSLRLVDPDVLHRNEWSFIRNRERVSFPPPELNKSRRYWDVWRCSQIGQIRVERVTLPSCTCVSVPCICIC